MKTEIHPEYMETRVHCSCGNEFVTRSTRETLTVELCNECHPFYTGKQKLVDTGGRVERFRKRTEKTDKQALASKKAKRADKAKIKKSDAKPSSAAKSTTSKPARPKSAPRPKQAAQKPEAEKVLATDEPVEAEEAVEADSLAEESAEA